MGHPFKKGSCLSSNLPFGSKKLKMGENVEAQKKMTLHFFFFKLNTLKMPEEPYSSPTLFNNCWTSNQTVQPVRDRRQLRPLWGSPDLGLNHLVSRELGQLLNILEQHLYLRFTSKIDCRLNEDACKTFCTAPGWHSGSKNGNCSRKAEKEWDRFVWSICLLFLPRKTSCCTDFHHRSKYEAVRCSKFFSKGICQHTD